MYELLIAEILGNKITILMETVKSHGGFDNFDQFRSSISEEFKHVLEYEVGKVERRGKFWNATVDELAERIGQLQQVSQVD